MSDTAHREKEFENYIVKKLHEQGWLVGDTKHYDIEHALYPEDLMAWLTATQKAKWEKLEAMNGSNAATMEYDAWSGTRIPREYST